MKIRCNQNHHQHQHHQEDQTNTVETDTVELPKELIQDIINKLIKLNGLQAFKTVSYTGVGYFEIDESDITVINNNNLIDILEGYL